MARRTCTTRSWLGLLSLSLAAACSSSPPPDLGADLASEPGDHHPS